MIDILETFLAEKGIYTLTFILMGLGIFGMIFCGNYMKKIMCMNIMQVSIIFFFLALGQKEQGTLPVIVENLLGADAYINPLPLALMLTAIVLGLGVSTAGITIGTVTLRGMSLATVTAILLSVSFRLIARIRNPK